MASPEQSLGTTVGSRYALLSVIGKGAMGSVYRARDAQTNGEVAVKLLRSEFASDTEVRRRFRRESSILLALTHPGLVRVVDYGEEPHGQLYTVMELLTGESLEARLLRTGPYEAASLKSFLDPICETLDAVHEHGVLHGDIKPSNIFLTDSDTVKVLDFGLSKVHGLERLTQTGEMAGTPAYMAPELLTGKGNASPAADVYSLGVVLYESLSGRRPFAGTHPGKLLYDIARGSYPQLRSLCPHVPSSVERVIVRAMSHESADRFASAGALSTAYSKALSA